LNRWASYLLGSLTFGLWMMSVAGPAMALVVACFETNSSKVDARAPLQLLLTSVTWAAGISAASLAIGWLPGRWLGQLMQRREWRKFAPAAALVMTPLALPSYVVFYAWWQSWPAESALYVWVIQNNLMQFGRSFTLGLGLVCWSWPLVSLCVMGSAARRPGWRDDVLQLDGVAPIRIWIDRLRTDGRGLLMGGLLVFLATLGNTTCFDLAEIFTFANELRAIEALGASPRAMLLAAWPMIAVAWFGSLAIWRLLEHRPDFKVHGHQRTSITMLGLTLIIWSTSTVLPLILFLRHLVNNRGGLSRVLDEFTSLYRGSLQQTLCTALLASLAASIVAAGLVLFWQSGIRFFRWLALSMSLSWLFMALIPGTLAGIALRGSNDNPILRLVLESNAPSLLTSWITAGVLALGHLSVFGFIAALMARWAVSTEAERERDVRLIDGPAKFTQFLRAQRPRLTLAIVPTAVLVFVLSIGEIPVTAMINPPHRANAGPLALSLLNDMHYQRPQTVMIAAAGMMILALLAATAVAMAIVLSRKSRR